MSWRSVSSSLAVLALAGQAFAQAGVGTALATKLEGPSGLALNDAGDLYVADTRQHRVLKVATSGAVTIVAGTGKRGYSGDGGPATSAKLNAPTGLTVAPDGSLFLADTGNHVIRSVRPDGMIVTVAGTGRKGFAGDGMLASAARLSEPLDVEAASDRTLYIADGAGVRKVTPSGVIQTLVALKTSPLALALDHRGTLYVSRFTSVARLTSSGTLETVAGNEYLGGDGDGKKATIARLSNALGLAVDSSDNLYISDQNNRRIRKVDRDGFISTVAGDATYSAIYNDYIPKLYAWPSGLAVDTSGNVYYTAGGDAVKDSRPSPIPGLRTGNVEQVIADTSYILARGIVLGKDFTLLPWNGARLIVKESPERVVVPVVGKVP